MTQRPTADGTLHWAPPSCHLKLGKSPSQCALQEIRRQTGLNAKRAKRIRWAGGVLDPLDTHTITLVVEVTDFDEGYELANGGKWFELSELGQDQLAQISLDQNVHLS